MTGSRLLYEDLGSLGRIAAGGQGTVYEAPSVRLKLTRSKLVYKEYIADVQADLDVSVLEWMPTYLENLPHREAMELLSVAAWPCRLVETDGVVTGFVMPAVPGEFYLDIRKARGVSRTLGEFQHLLNPPGFLASRRIPLTDRDRYQLLAEVAMALDVFHRHNISIGDLSPKNLLFSLQPQTKVYFIDCDTMRFQGKSITRQAETPDWDIRTANPREELATPQSDAYKFGLLALRLLASRQQTRDPNTLPGRQPPTISRLLARSLSPRPAKRPTPMEWVKPLQAAADTASTRPPTPSPQGLQHPALPAQPPPAQPVPQPSVLRQPPRLQHPAPPAQPVPQPSVQPHPYTPARPAIGGRPIRVIAGLAFVAAAGLEWWVYRDIRELLVSWNYALVVLLVSLLGLRRYSGADRRRAEACGLLAAAAGAYLYISDPFLLLDFAPGTDSDGGLLSLAVAGYGFSAICAPTWSVLSFVARRGEGPPSTHQIAILVEEDRTTLRRLAWITLTCVIPAALGLILLLVTSPSQDLSFDRLVFLFLASPRNVLIAITANGVWLPVLVAGLILLVRGRWSHRPAGSIWALVLLLAAGIAWPVSRSFADTNISEAHHVTVTTPVPAAVVDGGRFCERYWTMTYEPVRAFIAGEACDTFYQYNGWYEDWSVSLSQHSIDDLLSIGETYIVIADGSSMAIGVSGTGNRIWDYRCDGAMTIDETQLNAGLNTPDDQVFAGTCGSTGTGENPFRLDPSTGNSLTLPSDTTAAPTTSTTFPPGDGSDELVGDSSTREPATSTTIPPNPGDAVSCADFEDHAAAQEWYDTYWPHYGDVALIDINDNGVACEKLLTETERATTTTRRTTDGNSP